MRIIHIHDIVRPPQSKTMIKRAFDVVDCRRCHECCRVPFGRFRTPVMKSDRNYIQILREVLQTAPRCIIGNAGEAFDFLGDKKCIFAQENHSGGFDCRIYPIRPNACCETPFSEGRVELKTVYGEERTHENIILLSSLCPPVKQLEIEKVAYITPKDILPERKKDDGYINILSKALLAVLSYPEGRTFTAINGELAFLIR